MILSVKSGSSKYLILSQKIGLQFSSETISLHRPISLISWGSISARFWSDTESLCELCFEYEWDLLLLFTVVSPSISEYSLASDCTTGDGAYIIMRAWFDMSVTAPDFPYTSSSWDLFWMMVRTRMLYPAWYEMDFAIMFTLPIAVNSSRIIRHWYLSDGSCFGSVLVFWFRSWSKNRLTMTAASASLSGVMPR